MLTDAFTSALANLVVLVAIPFAAYYAYHRIRHSRRLDDVLLRTGLKIGERRYIGYCLLAAAVLAAALLIWNPPLDPWLREGSAFKSFEGAGLNERGIGAALLYGVVKTGFSEEFLFRGLIAGSLSRRLAVGWANIAQGLIFLLPHALVVMIAPEFWMLLPLIFVGALFAGWVRIASGSMLGPWLLHAVVNVTMALMISGRTTP